MPPTTLCTGYYLHSTCAFYLGSKQPEPTVWAWKPFESTTTFVAATVVTIVNTLSNVTARSTIFNSRPNDVKIAEINELGTHIGTVTYTMAPLDKEETITSTVL